MKEVLAWNKANMVRWIYELANPFCTSLWKTWICSYKCHTQSVWGVVSKQSDSKWWRDLLRLRDEIALRLTWPAIEALFSQTRSQVLGAIYDILRPRGARVAWWQMVWHKFNVPRVSFIAWLAYLGRLQTSNRVSRYKHNVDTTCSLCSACSESVEHLFFLCPFAREVYQGLCNVLSFHVRFGHFRSGSASLAKLGL